QLVLVLLDRVEPDFADVLDSGPEADGLGNRLRPGLELRRHLPPARVLEPDAADHVAAEVERLHLLEELHPAPERADPARTAELVRGDRHEVGAERLNLDDPV